jgi:hypothetical protein
MSPCDIGDIIYRATKEKEQLENKSLSASINDTPSTVRTPIKHISHISKLLNSHALQ